MNNHLAIESNLGKAFPLLFRTKVLLVQFWKIQPLMQPQYMRLATIQMHSFISQLPPRSLTAFSINSRSILFELFEAMMIERYLTRFLQIMILILSMSKQMPLLSQTFQYFLLSSSQALKSAVLIALMISKYYLKSPHLSLGLGQQSLPSNILQGIKYFITSFFCPLLLKLIFMKHCSAQTKFQLTRAYLPFWNRKLSIHYSLTSPQFLAEQMILWTCWQL